MKASVSGTTPLTVAPDQQKHRFKVRVLDVEQVL